MNRMSKQTLPVEMPAAFLPLLAKSGAFKVSQQGDRIILEPVQSNGNGHKAVKMVPKPAQDAPGTQEKAHLKYYPADRRVKPESLEKFGMSPTRLKVYKVIYRNAKRGLLARDIMTKTELPHGSVQQTLHWLREHKMVKGEVLTS